MSRSGKPPPFAGGRDHQARVSRYSRRVRWMKIALPVAAGALVVAIFLTGRSQEEGSALLSPEEIATLAAGLRLEDPRIAGLTDSGQPFILRARWAEPDGPSPDRIRLAEPDGELTLEDGRLMTGQAASGVFERSAGRIWLEGEVEMRTSDGYRFESDKLRIVIDAREVTSPGPVFGEGPAGTISAQTMQLDRPAPGKPGAGGSRIVFNGRVHMVFIPASARGSEQTEAAAISGEDVR
ncbi:MAG: hypothetical protein ACFBRM_15600 [Pikeienuella sp.]